VLLDVVGRRTQDLRIVTHEPEPLVASLAEKLPGPPRGVIVIEVLRGRLTTDGATIVLGRTDVGELPLGEPVPPIEVRLTVGDAVAGFAPAAEAGRCSAVADIVLVRDGLLASRAPTEAGRDPRMIADLLTHRVTVLPVPRVVALPVAGQAVEGEAVTQ
jgi:hypothetical protein